MPRLSRKEMVEAGMLFWQFLQDTGRAGVSSRGELRTIYEEEFRSRDDQKRPSFSNMLYNMRTANLAELRGDSVAFGKVVRKTKVKLVDLYRRPQPDPVMEDAKQPSADAKAYSKGQAKAIVVALRRNRASFINKKMGVDIHSEYDLDSGRIRFPFVPNEQNTIQIRIENSGPGEVMFTQYRVLRRFHVFSFVDKRTVSKTNPLLLRPGDSYEVQVQFYSKFCGYFPITVVFEFACREGGGDQRFNIGRFLSAVAKSNLSNELGPTAPYKPYQANIRKPTIVVVDDGIKPENFLTYDLENTISLGMYDYPPKLKEVIQIGLDAKGLPSTALKDEAARVKSLLFSLLQFKNYNSRFQLLLHLEEIQMEVDIRRYDQTDMPMVRDQRNRRLLVLEVPGVAENRPSVLRGDHLFVTLAEERGGQNLVHYKGYVHAVELEKVKLGFSDNLMRVFVDNMKFDVTFTFSRLPLRLQHRAVQLAAENHLKDILFPSFSYGESIVPLEKELRLFDRKLEENQEQYTAVKQIVSGCSRPAPYLIFGPPGTGKTVTLVEAIKQVLTCIPTSRVLACAPSNSASDLLCQRLMKHIDKKDIYRMIALSRDFRMVPEEIKPCCNWSNEKQGYVYPKKGVLMEYRVIITTLVTAGRLVSANFPQGHFSHVFIDESGHAVEPECVIGIAGILDVMDHNSNKNGGQLVLAGDPKQLGPILRSPLAIEHGLGVSLLERLMTDNSLYQKTSGQYNPQFVTKLLHNYRSHSAILKTPNELFYDNELQENADEMISHSYCHWDHLPTKEFPVIFHGVLGEDQRESTSPSFFNITEVEIVLVYLKKLLNAQGKAGQGKISPKEIGIISPYRKQVEKLRRAITIVDPALKGLNEIKDLKVGSVEEFQGQERRVIIISTVRSSVDYVKIDEDFSLGFLRNPKRFNVAATRAKALLIVVGNPIILSKDVSWYKFLTYCKQEGGYVGYSYEEDRMEEEDLLTQLRSLRLSIEPPGDPSGESQIQQQVSPEWRNDM
ncbi:helicase MOV-10 [Rhinatrema bivittatum]|uniref:helicase MOV-10 n=1 Tax=Rhinatrema bivittatum TaxID=194408 RepID=UPI0011283B90|nr:helicase MOV-10 [Rhinatrema bivittatum]